MSRQSSATGKHTPYIHQSIPGLRNGIWDDLVPQVILSLGVPVNSLCVSLHPAGTLGKEKPAEASHSAMSCAGGIEFCAGDIVKRPLRSAGRETVAAGEQFSPNCSPLPRPFSHT
ncbi:cyclic nucleotide-gated cation channel beta-1 [Platysternon megacephalum]|uniref:Cyclic nucleotide-gated cation channel beta-1 n=1 Tax=Platysternon megacephalum TaxID=55544 RepID=A0A4D9E063_9SAUR|nr:cyclic nucleotide-gated cation channel beta-1 [Platysternon megacephalum]